MNGAWRRALVAVLALLALATSAAAADEARVNAALIEGHVLARYQRLVTASDAFALAAAAQCPAGDRALAAFHATMDAWMGIEHVRFGPVELFMRGYRFHFWPQARGRVFDSVRALVQAGDGAVPTAAQLAQADLAVQGLPAAEALLYGGQRLTAPDAPRACRLLAAIAANMRAMAGEIAAAWRRGDASFAVDAREASFAFLTSLHDGLQRLADVKLKPVLGRDIASARPVLAESRLSGRSLRNMVANLAALQALYLGEGGPGLGALAAAADPALDRLLTKAFAATMATAQGIARPLDEAVLDPALRPQAEKLLLQLRALRQLVRERLAPALGLPLGFNAFDGD